MSTAQERDQKQRTLFSKSERKRVYFKSIRNNQNIAFNLKYRLMLSLKRYGTITRIRNRCILTGRGRAVSQFNRLSRIKFRELAECGLLAGIKKSSW